MSVDALVALTEEEIDARPWRGLRDWTGVRDKVLWEDPETRSYAGLMHMEPGATIEPHIHERSTHHVWVVEGTCSTVGRALGPGSYSFVPPGVEHGISDVGSKGCTLFYLYLRERRT